MKLRKKAVLCAIIAAILLSPAARLIKTTESALALTPISETEALSRAVTLYEQLAGDEIYVPQELADEGMSKEMLKSVIMGYINMDDTYSVLEGGTIRRQDFYSILYKTIVRMDDSYMIFDDEANAILNQCYDNVYIDDVNRIPYAFMMKQGIITEKSGNEPQGELTQEECETLIQHLYDLFAKNVTLSVGLADITIGANISTVTDVLGTPNRIDKTEYGFEWYVYNADYDKFCMVGVTAERICAFFTNSSQFDMKGINAGDEFAYTADYEGSNCFYFFPTSDGKVDSVLYNPFQRQVDTSADVKRSKSLLLLDMINAKRAKDGKQIYAEDPELSSDAWLSQISTAAADANDVTELNGFDIIALYGRMVSEDNEILTQETDYVTPLGITSSNELSGGVKTTIISDTEREAELGEITYAEIPEINYELNEITDVTTPVLLSPKTENIYNEGDDIIIELATQASTKYHVEVFDLELEEYVINEFLVTDETEINLPAELFKNGRDYRLAVSAITPDGEALPGEDVLISYGSVYDSGVEIIAPYNEGILDDDYLDVAWKSDEYHDFVVDLYNQDDELVSSTRVENAYETQIKGIEGGKYYLSVTALRRGTEVKKAQDHVTFTSRLPEPVINEIILNKDDVYYYVYENEEMGLLYFYDEELIDVDEGGKTVTKKKIIQKQVKATDGYRKLAKYRSKPTSTTGDPTITQHAFLVYDGTKGSQIVNEAAKYIGVPYVWGGETPNGFDCSGLVKYVLNSLGVNVNRVAEDQFKNGVSVNRDELQQGDLVFFEQNGYIHHVGIYVGGGMMIHAPHTGDVVKYQSIDSDYYRSQYAGARRVY